MNLPLSLPEFLRNIKESVTIKLTYLLIRLIKHDGIIPHVL